MPHLRKLKVVETVTSSDSGRREEIEPDTYDFLAGFTDQFEGVAPSEWLCVFVSADDPDVRHEVKGTTFSKWKAEGKVALMG